MAQEVAVRKDLSSFVSSVVELPTMPDVLRRLDDVISYPNASAADVAAVVQTDPAIAANMLRIVNSAHFGLQVRITSINVAVSVMGFSLTKKIALRAAVMSSFGGGPSVQGLLDPRSFWRHSGCVAIAAREIGRRLPAFSSVHIEDLYVAGLLHDLGKVLLMEHSPERYAKVLRRAAAEVVPDAAVEAQDYGFTHAEVGALLADRWQLPQPLTQAIRFHHQPGAAGVDGAQAVLVHAANYAAARLACASTGSQSGAGQRGVLEVAALAVIGLTKQRLEELLPELGAEFANADMSG